MKIMYPQSGMPSEKHYAGRIEYNFDILDKKSYYYFFVKNYMQMTYEGLHELSYPFKGKTIYDIGFGHGRAFSIYKSLGINKVIGFEVNGADAEYACDNAERLGIDLEVRMNYDNKEIKKIADNSCDIVSIMYALAFIPPILRKEIIEHAKRIAKQGGIVIIVDIPSRSLMSCFNSLVRMLRTFSGISEWQEFFQPMKMIQMKGCNHWYFFNAPMDVLGKCSGLMAYSALDYIAKKLRFTPSTSLMVFQK